MRFNPGVLSVAGALASVISGCGRADSGVDASSPNIVTTARTSQPSSALARAGGEHLSALKWIEPPQPSDTCSVAPLQAASVCEPGKDCPITAALEFSCEGSGYGPWLVSDALGASLMFVTNSAEFRTHLFRVRGADAETFELSLPTAAINTLASDPSGQLAVFAGEMPGLDYLHERGLGWTQEAGLSVGASSQALPRDARVLSDRAYVGYVDLADYLPRLARFQAGAWHTQALSQQAAMAVGLDAETATGRPWLAWAERERASGTRLELSDGDRRFEVWRHADVDVMSFWQGLRVLAPAPNAVAALPTLAIQASDAVHVLRPLGDSTWQDQALEASALASTDGDCNSLLGASSCGGRASCTLERHGAANGLGLARTASGRVFAAWLNLDTTASYALSFSAVDAACYGAFSSQCGTEEIVLVELDPLQPSARVVQRFPISVAGGRSSLDPRLALAARGEHVLLAAALDANDSRVVYLDLDTSALR